jgi:hypothetical protein
MVLSLARRWILTVGSIVHKKRNSDFESEEQIWKEILIDPRSEPGSLVHLTFRKNGLELVTQQVGMPTF